MNDDVLRTVSDGAEERYVRKGGVRCPCCNSEYIEGQSFDVEGASAVQEVSCADCGLTWTDVFTLSSVRIDGIGRIERLLSQ